MGLGFYENCISRYLTGPSTLMVCDEDATLELRVRTVKYFKDLWSVHQDLNETVSDAEMKKFSIGRYNSVWETK